VHRVGPTECPNGQGEPDHSLTRVLRRVVAALAFAVSWEAAASGALAQDGAPVVAVVGNAEYGPILADPDGWTLYWWDGDSPWASYCADGCADLYPPYATDAEIAAPREVSEQISAIEREDGSWQITYEGWPLYYFSGDGQPGDVNGAGSDAYDALWSVVPISLPQSETPAPQAPTPEQVPPPSPLPEAPQPPVVPRPIEQPIPPAQPAREPSAPQFPPSALPYPPPSYYPVVAPLGPYDPVVRVVAPDGGTITLTWLADPGAVSYRIYQTTSPFPVSFGLRQTVRQTSGSLVSLDSVSGLTPGTQYFFQIRAVDPTGEERVAPAAAIVTPGFANVAIAPPTGVKVTDTTSTTATITWRASAGAVRYDVWQAQDPAGPFTLASVSNATSSGAIVGSLAPVTTYYFQVVALDRLGTPSAPSNTAVATTEPSILPPGSVSVALVTSTTATLHWVPSTGAVSYEVQESSSLGGPFFAVAPVSSSTRGATVGGLSPGAAYYFQVVAIDASGARSEPSNTAMAITTVPTPEAPRIAAPTRLVAVAMSASAIALSWGASDGATAYVPYMSTSRSGPYTATDSTAGTSATITGLSPSTTYYFQVVAIDASGNQSAPSNTASAATSSALTAPSVVVTNVGPRAVGLRWTPVPGATSYVVAQATTASGPFTPSALIEARGNEAAVTALTPTTTYYFQVTAVDAAGNQGPPSTPVAVTTTQ